MCDGMSGCLMACGLGSLGLMGSPAFLNAFPTGLPDSRLSLSLSRCSLI